MAPQSHADRLVEKYAPYCEKQFFNNLAGATHRNADRTSRVRIIGETDPGDELELVPDSENRYDANAIGVFNQLGEQLGFLQAWTAREVARDLREERREWVCFLAHHNFHPETDKLVGATLLLISLSKESKAAGCALFAQTVALQADKASRLEAVLAARAERIASMPSRPIITSMPSRPMSSGWLGRIRRVIFGR
jgi:hypothetical protein